MMMNKTRTNIHDLSGFQTHSLSVQAIKAYTSDCVAAEIVIIMLMEMHHKIFTTEGHLRNMQANVLTSSKIQTYRPHCSSNRRLCTL
jgi:hypothetical protein